MNPAGLSWPGRLPRFLWMRRQCPLCSSVRFQPAESQPLDALFALIGLQPLRCANCWRRYYCFAGVYRRPA